VEGMGGGFFRKWIRRSVVDLNYAFLSRRDVVVWILSESTKITGIVRFATRINHLKGIAIRAEIKYAELST